MITVPKGTHDVILEEANAYTSIEDTLKAAAVIYGYNEFRTPIIESSELFCRSVGESSDVVRKEMYTFLDKGDRSISLRPEFTAGVIRSINNNKLWANQDYPIKAYYVGPCFRYERPQQGRFRQFNQFGVEAVGINSPLMDAEVILCGYQALKMLGFENVTLKINTIGDEESRNNYKKALVEFFSSKIDNMCSDCKERLKLNPLRILDCKVPEDQEIVKSAPKISSYLTSQANDDFEKVRQMLDLYEIPYEIDDTLVRGLDYYSNTVFEFHYKSKLGNNYGAIGAGGHYNKIVNELGGPDIAGVGFSMGIERLFLVMKEDGLIIPSLDEVTFYVMPLADSVKEHAFIAATNLRMSGYRTEICLETKSFSAMFKKAERRNTKFAVIIGEDEVKNDTVIIKDLEKKDQITVPFASLIDKADELAGVEDDEDCHCHDEGCHCHDDDCDCDCDCDCEDDNCECGKHECHCKDKK